MAIHVENTGNLFRLTISDDGCGITPEKLARPATLRALRQRAEALNGQLHVSSEPEQGTRLELAIPLPKSKRRRQS